MTALMTVPNRTVAPVRTERDPTRGAPIVAAVDASLASSAAVEEAVRLASEAGAPLVFVYVRRGPAGFFGAPLYQRRLTTEMRRARRVLDRALRAAAFAGIAAEAEILEGSPARHVADFALRRGAQVVVVGSRRRRLGRSVAWAITRAAELPVIIASRHPAGLREAAAVAPSS
jgi:nucleotide-binding universal stress UspA family protein